MTRFRIWIYTNGDFKLERGLADGARLHRRAGLHLHRRRGVLLREAAQRGQPQSGQRSLLAARAGAGTALPAAGDTQVQQYDPIIEFGRALWLRVGRSFSQGPFSASLSLTLQGTFQGVLAWNAPDGDPNKSSSSQLAASVNAWRGAVLPVTPAGSILNLSHVVFATIEGARLPLIQLPQVQYSAPSGWWQPESGG